jgi:ubiquinone biosynthesis protein COQ9
MRREGDMDFQDIRDRLILAALPHAVFEGWSAKAFAEACADLGLDATMAERAFMGGPAQAAEHFADLGDRMMAADCAAVNMAGLKVPARIALAIKLRLSRWAPHREALRRALSVLAMPGNAPIAAKATWRTVDSMWRATGDCAADFSWYTKRGTLAAVYTAALLYWLDDPSEDCAATWAFVDRRLADVGRITKARRSLETWFAGLPKPKTPIKA